MPLEESPESDWSNSRLTALWTPNGPQQPMIPEADHISPLLECGDGTKYEPPLGIQLHEPTTLVHLWSSGEAVKASAIWLGECQELLGASLEGITKGERNPRMLNMQAGAAAVVAAEEKRSDTEWMPASGCPGHVVRILSTRFVHMLTNSLIQQAQDPYPSLLRQSMLQWRIHTRLMKIGTAMVNVETVTDDGGPIPAQYPDM